MSDFDTLPCPECGRPFGEHTMTEYRRHTATNVPFEQIPGDPVPGPVPPTNLAMADHVDVIAGVIEAETATGRLVLPCVEFHFHWGNEALAPVRFVADQDVTFRQLRQLVSGACDAAPMRAKQRRRDLGRQQGDDG